MLVGEQTSGNGFEPFREGKVRGFLHHSARPGHMGLVLTHGAGGDCTAPLLIAVARAFAAAGFHVLRCDLPFRQKQPHGPPPFCSGVEDRAGLTDALAAMRSIVRGHVFLGGQSYGGRQASILAAAEPRLADALLLLSYPLHPPAKPAQVRTSHFPALRTKALFVHGSRDPFATAEELRAAVALIPAGTSIVEIASAGHDLMRGSFDAEQLVVEPFLRLTADAAAAPGSYLADRSN
jgi:predicted alpha/beta-hydrolase family hydrolase